MQNYKTVKDTDSIQSSREIFNNAITSAVSNNSGTAFPTDNLVVGMKCYRSDLGKTYTLTDVTNKTWKEDSKADSADKATKLATARTISLTGKATGSASFDGSANASINVTAVTADSCSGNSATASEVAWTGITGKPSTYTPATHNHDTSYPSTSGSRATGTWGISVTGTSANVTQRKSATAVTSADYPNNQAYVPDMSFMAYWNGAYNSSNSSNLKYCANGTIIGSNTISSQSVKYATSAGTATTATTANAVAWDNVTGKPSTYTPASHKHGLNSSDLTAFVDTKTDAWNIIGENKDYLLKSIRTGGTTPIWLCNDYSAGIAFGGSDTKGVMSLNYNTPHIKIAGGNGSKPVWWIGLSGTSSNTYNLNNFPTKTGTGATGTWGINVTGSAGSVAWGNVTGKPSTYTPASHTHSYLPLSGGTLDNGNWNSSSTILIKSANKYQTIEFDCAGDNFSGGFLALHSELLGGGFSLGASYPDTDSTNGYQLIALRGSAKNDTLDWGSCDLAGTAIVSKFLAPSGYIKYKSGLVLQWGSTYLSTGTSTYTVTLPITLTTFLNAQVTTSAISQKFTITSGTSNFKVTFASNPSSSSDMYWFVVGTWK